MEASNNKVGIQPSLYARIMLEVHLTCAYIQMRFTEHSEGTGLK